MVSGLRSRRFNASWARAGPAIPWTYTSRPANRIMTMSTTTMMLRCRVPESARSVSRAMLGILRLVGIGPDEGAGLEIDVGDGLPGDHAQRLCLLGEASRRGEPVHLRGLFLVVL